MNKDWYCQKCGNKMAEEEANCPKCGSGDFFTGAVWNDETKSFACACGCKTGKRLSHVDGSKWYSSTFECNECGNCITLHNARDEESMMYWEY